MSRSKRTPTWLTFMSGVILAAALALPTHAQTSATVYEGARLITGGGGTIENSAFVVENGRIVEGHWMVFGSGAEGTRLWWSPLDSAGNRREVV